jgi:hypothetical protein
MKLSNFNLISYLKIKLALLECDRAPSKSKLSEMLDISIKLSELNIRG